MPDTNRLNFVKQRKADMFTFRSTCTALQYFVCFKEIFSRELPYSVKSGKRVEGKWSNIKALPHMNNLPSVRWNCVDCEF